MSVRIFILLLLMSSFATAQETMYRLEEGGSLTLEQDVENAVAAWLEALPDARIEASEEAPNLIRAGDSALFGPDTLSVSVQRQGEERSLEVLLNPSSTGLNEAALIHEIGLLLGLSTAETGVMSPMLSADSDLSIGETERASFQANQNFAREDINRDGVIDFYDLNELASLYGQSTFNQAADINEDGMVDEADLALLQEAYSFTPPSSSPPRGSPSLEQDETSDASPEEGDLEPEPEEESNPESPDSEVPDPEGEGEPPLEEPSPPDDAGDSGTQNGDNGNSSDDPPEDGDP